MKPLSNEVQLVVLDHLDALDIAQLEQTCKHFRSLIGHSPSVWRNCLHRRCIKNGVFWPSYKDLSTVSEFKEACTRVWRLGRKYEDCCKSGDHLSRASTTIEFPDQGDTDADVKEMRLVPGGRFIVTVSNESWQLSLWDLGPMKNKKPQLSASALYHHSLTPGEELCHLEVLGATKIRILLQLEMDALRVKAFSLIELELLENDEVTFQRLGVLPFKDIIYVDGPLTSCTLIEDKVIMSVNGRVTLVWDFIQGTYSGWQMVKIPPAELKVFVNERFAIHTSIAGVDIVEIPSPTLVPSSGLSSDSFSKASLLLSLPYTHPSGGGWPGAFLSAQARQTPWVDLPLALEVAQYNETGALTLHRYHLVFDPMNPSRSTLELVENINGGPFPHMNSISSSCDGRLANFWRHPESPVTVPLFSLSPTVTNSSSPSKTEQRGGGLQFVPFLSEQTLPGTQLLGPFDICLMSAKALVTWWKERGGDEGGSLFSVLHDMV